MLQMVGLTYRQCAPPATPVCRLPPARAAMRNVRIGHSGRTASSGWTSSPNSSGLTTPLLREACDFTPFQPPHAIPHGANSHCNNYTSVSADQTSELLSAAVHAVTLTTDSCAKPTRHESTTCPGLNRDKHTDIRAYHKADKALQRIICRAGAGAVWPNPARHEA